jgi:hypothetical protein
MTRCWAKKAKIAAHGGSFLVPNPTFNPIKGLFFNADLT